MHRLKTIIRFAVYVTISVLIAAESSVGQDITVQIKKGNLAQLPLEKVLIEKEGIVQLFSSFSFAYNIPVGLEVARGGDTPSLYVIDFKKGTLSELMTQFVSEHEEYVWEISDGVVHVFPKEHYRDPIVRELLETRIRRFHVAQKTTTVLFGENLLSTPEINRIIKRYGIKYDTGYLGGFYIQQLGQRYSLQTSDMQLRSILDKVVKESPVARNWFIMNDNSAQRLYLRVHAMLEYPRKP
jgi:hypothetical protein